MRFSGEYPQAMELLANGKIKSEVIDHRSRSTQGRSALVRGRLHAGEAKSHEGWWLDPSA